MHGEAEGESQTRQWTLTKAAISKSLAYLYDGLLSNTPPDGLGSSSYHRFVGAALTAARRERERTVASIV